MNIATQARQAIARQEGKRKRGRPKDQSLEMAIDKIEQGRVLDAEVVYENDPVSEGKAKSSELQAEREQQLKPYQDGLPFDLERIKQQILNSGVNILEETVTIGKYLIWVKEEVGHGNFVSWIESELGMSKERSAEFMRIARRVIESKSASVRAFLRTVAGQSKMKLLALLEVSDEEIEEVIETQTFLGRDLDEVETMSFRQLRDALREERALNQDLRDQREERERELRRVKVDLEKEQARNEGESVVPIDKIAKFFLRATQVLGDGEEMGMEFFEEYEDTEILEIPDYEGRVRAFISTIRQKTTVLEHVFLPEDLFGKRRFFPHRPDALEDEG